jgi:hypothetical protein
MSHHWAEAPICRSPRSLSVSTGREGWRTAAVSIGLTIVRFVRKFFGPSARSLARARSLRLLEENLSPNQLEHFSKRRFFHVVGGTTGNHYRISYGTSMNVSQIDKNGFAVRRLCFYPQHALPEGDVLLAQKLALELFELDALTVANKLHPDAVDFRRWSETCGPVNRTTDYEW